MMIIRSNGKDLEGFSEVSVTDSVDTLCNKFVLKCSADEAFTFPIPRGASIEVFVQDKNILTGSLEKISGNYGEEKYNISGYGRDKTKAVLKADLDPKVSIKAPISLKRVLELGLKLENIDLEVIDEVGDLEDFEKGELLTDEVGAKMWDFWKALAEKRQVLITRNSDGNIVIRRPNQNKYRKVLRHIISDPNGQNNIIGGDFDFDDSERKHEYNIYSQENFTVGKKAVDTLEVDLFPEQNVEPKIEDVRADATAQLNKINYFKKRAKKGSQADRVLTAAEAEIETSGSAGFRRSRVASKGTATDDSVPDGVMHKTAEFPSTNAECQKQADWEANAARVASNTYTCSVADEIADDEPWEAGYLIDVIDEVAAIDSTMLIQSVEFSEAVSEDGEATEIVNLTLTIPDGYSQDSVPSATLAQTGTIGEGWNEGDFK